MDSGLVGLLTIARYHGLAADGAQVVRELGGSSVSFGDVEVLRAARMLGLKARLLTSRWSRLAAAPLPALARQHDGAFVILAKVDGERVLVHDARGRPEMLSRATFEAEWTGRLVLLTPATPGVTGARRFGFRWFVPAILKYRALLIEVLIASFVLQLFALVSPLLTQVIIDKVLVHKGLATLHVLAIAMGAIAVFEVALGGLRAYVFAHTTNRIDVELGAQLFRHVLRLPLAYFEARRVGDTVARARELETIRQCLTGSTVTIVIDLVFAGAFVAVMFLYSPALTWIVVGTVPLYVLLSFVTMPIFRARLEEKFGRGAESHAFLVEAISGIETVKAMAIEPQLQRRWESTLAGYVRASFRATALGNVAGQCAAFVNKATTVAILWLGAHAVIAGALTLGELIAFTMLSSRAVGPLLRIIQLWQEFQQAGVSVDRLGDLMNAVAEPSSTPGRTALPALVGGVAFEQVTFRYRPDRGEALRALSFTVAPGTVVGIVGHSGSGKSTVAKLMQRLYVPERGRILIDGVDLALVDPAWLRRQIGVVLQESFLFNRSVRDNIAVADPGMALDRVTAAARLAGAHDFIVELPESYDTLVGEHGCALSGGQRQRIAIARALVMDPRILILDEATSALDYESERLLQQNLAHIRRKRTVFIIAHRLSTVRQADCLLVLDRGAIVEGGTHAELLARGGYYARLHTLQSAGAPAFTIGGHDGNGDGRMEAAAGPHS